ncbi:hypothetical protein [Yoonia sp.]|uniref:hypothetical protein n=1 Tax=Yoonia sp. TaxID=2212373 RepID=UPI002DF8DB83|nr:hypothetical protein [Yoonia sp.]
MSKHEIITPACEAMKMHLMAAVEIAQAQQGGRQAIGEALCAALDTVAGGAPRYDLFSNMREDAAFWADVATPAELEIYIAAALHRIPRVTFAERARKRLFWALWETMPQTAKDGFLGRVQKEAAPP